MVFKIVIKIIFFAVVIALSVWMLTINTLEAKTKRQIIIGFVLWILGLYIGLGISSL